MNFNAEITLGTMNFGKSDWGLPKDVSFELLDTFFSLGYKKLDTSNFYAQGNSEKIIGEWLSYNSPDTIEICTKVGGKDPIDDSVVGLSRESILKSIEYSLKRLKRDSINILYLHFPDFKTYISETVETINYLLTMGVIKEWGISNYTALELSNIIQICNELSITKPKYFQILVNLIEFNATFEIIPLALSNNLNVYSWSPLSGGLLTNSAKLGHLDNRFNHDTFWNLYKENTFLNKLYKYSEEENIKLEELSLLFLLENKINPICGFSKKQELLELHNIFVRIIENVKNEKHLNYISNYHQSLMPYPYNLLKFMNCDKFHR